MKTTLILLLAGACLVGFTTLKPQTSKIPKPVKGIAKELGKGYSYVPSGSTIIDGKIVSFQSFFMLNVEVSNFEYRAFLDDLKLTGQTEKWKIAQIDTTQWMNLNAGSLQKYATYYHQHPAYSNYPVVNISHEAAKLYCEWVTEKVNKRLNVDKKYIFRLPEANEFIYAAEAGNTCQPYSWKGPFMRNSKGLFLCNHHWNSNEESDFFAGSTSEYMDVTAPVKSYWPNDFGIHNLNGNVAEMISEKGLAMGGSWNDAADHVRNASRSNYSTACPTVGFRIVVTVINE